MTDTAASSLALRTAQRYVEVAVANGKGDLADLFAVDAEFHNPRGVIVRGRENIRAFYAEHLANVVPAFHIARSVVDGAQCWVELANGSPDAPELVAANHYTVDADGLITRLAVFLRPRS